MGRLIDADRLKAHYCWWAGGSKEMSIDEAKKTFDTIIDVQPTVDAVEVVRCKDCKYGEPNGQYGCKCYHYKLYETHEMLPNDFCSKGKRREDETN